MQSLENVTLNSEHNHFIQSKDYIFFINHIRNNCRIPSYNTTFDKWEKIFIALETIPLIRTIDTVQIILYKILEL